MAWLGIIIFIYADRQEHKILSCLDPFLSYHLILERKTFGQCWDKTRLASSASEYNIYYAIASQALGLDFEVGLTPKREVLERNLTDQPETGGSRKQRFFCSEKGLRCSSRDSNRGLRRSEDPATIRNLFFRNRLNRS